MTGRDNDAAAEVSALVEQLFRAENEPGDRSVAERILAPDFIPITRGSGKVDDSRAATVAKFGTPANFERQVDQRKTNVAIFSVDAVAIATTLLPTVKNGTESAEYRNMQVFVERDGRWECVAWQVTRVGP